MSFFLFGVVCIPEVYLFPTALYKNKPGKVAFGEVVPCLLFMILFSGIYTGHFIFSINKLLKSVISTSLVRHDKRILYLTINIASKSIRNKFISEMMICLNL